MAHMQPATNQSFAAGHDYVRYLVAQVYIAGHTKRKHQALEQEHDELIEIVQKHKKRLVTGDDKIAALVSGRCRHV